MEKHDYQPSLLWALFSDWYEHQQDVGDLVHSHPIALYIYLRDKSGAYYMHGPKLYWADEPFSQSFSNCGQDDLWDNQENLGEVVAWDTRLHKTILIGKTYEEAIKKLNV